MLNRHAGCHGKNRHAGCHGKANSPLQGLTLDPTASPPSPPAQAWVVVIVPQRWGMTKGRAQEYGCWHRMGTCLCRRSLSYRDDLAHNTDLAQNLDLDHNIYSDSAQKTMANSLTHNIVTQTMVHITHPLQKTLPRNEYQLTFVRK